MALIGNVPTGTEEQHKLRVLNEEQWTDKLRQTHTDTLAACGALAGSAEARPGPRVTELVRVRERDRGGRR